MNKEYMSPEIEMVTLSLDSAILSASVKDPELEDFYVRDGEG